jgi:hypothetical protein
MKNSKKIKLQSGGVFEYSTASNFYNILTNLRAGFISDVRKEQAEQVIRWLKLNLDKLAEGGKSLTDDDMVHVAVLERVGITRNNKLVIKEHADLLNHLINLKGSELSIEELQSINVKFKFNNGIILPEIDVEKMHSSLVKLKRGGFDFARGYAGWQSIKKLSSNLLNISQIPQVFRNILEKAGILCGDTWSSNEWRILFQQAVIIDGSGYYFEEQINELGIKIGCGEEASHSQIFKPTPVRTHSLNSGI